MVNKKNKEQEKNKSVSVELLESYRKALYKVQEFFESVESFDMDEDIDKTMKVVSSILKTGSELGKNIETLSILEKRVQSEEAIKSKIRGGGDLGLFESQ